MPTTEASSAVLTLFSQLIDKVKSSQPLRTDGKSLTAGFVYSQMPLGVMVRKEEYNNPWSPMGGSSLATANNLPPQPTVTTGSTTSTPPQPPDKRTVMALEAAFKTAQLVDKMLMVSKDNAYIEYPTERKVSLAYEGVINGMQSIPVPPLPADIQKRLDDANKILYQPDVDDTTILVKTGLYKKYQKNASAYANAKATYELLKKKTLNDPAMADSWPMLSANVQRDVDNAFDDWKTEGAEKVERALSTIESIGKSIQEEMIAKSRKLYDAFSLGLAGVPTTIPYSYLSPSNWSDCEADDDGWQNLTISSSEYHAHSEAHNSDTEASGFGFFPGFTIGGSGGSSNSSSSFHNDAKNLEVSIDYGMVTIYRPWLIGDMFYMKNWYLVNAPANSVSNGTIDGQNESLLPMIPQQFLAIRNVKITSSDWGQDGNAISSSINGGGGFTFGPIGFGGSHLQSDSESNYSSHFDGSTLRIKGTQIIAWLSSIVPICAPLGDPGLEKKKTKPQ